MLRSELVKHIADQYPELTPLDVDRIVNTVFGEISDSFVKGERVELRGFGTFSVRHRGPRSARNPRTGEHVDVADKFVPVFKSGRKLRERLNEDNDD